MRFKNNVLVVLTDDYMKIGGLRIPATNYLKFLEEKYHINKVLLGYRLKGKEEKKIIKSQLLEKINDDTKAIIIFSGINQAFITMRLIEKEVPSACKKIFYIADSPYLFIKSHLELCKEDILSVKKRIGYQLRKLLYYYKERYVLLKYDEVIYISPVDANFVKENYKTIKANISIISHATEIQQSYKLAKRIDVNCFRLGFLSAISEQTFIESIKPLIYDIMPKIVDKFPSTKLLIIGKGTSTKRVEEIKKLSYVEYIDYVEDLDDFYNNIDIVVAPIRKRNGILNKVLEAWGYGKCTVGYNYNFEAFTEAQDGIHYVCGNNSIEIANRVIDIISGRINVEKIGQAAYELLRENYNWENQKQKFMKIVG